MVLLLLLASVAAAAAAAAAADECALQELVGPWLEDESGTRRPTCATVAEEKGGGRWPLVGLLVASSVCESCLALRPLLRALPDGLLRLVLVSRDPNAARFHRHLAALGPAALAVPYEDETANDRLGHPPLPTVSSCVPCILLG